MKIIKLIFFVLTWCSVNAQSSNQLIRLTNAANFTVLNSITNPIAGNLAYMQFEDKIYYHDGTSWKALSSESNSGWFFDGNSVVNNNFIGINGSVTHSDDFRIRTNNRQRMVIKKDGKVGINNTNPSGQFEVNEENVVLPALSNNNSLLAILSGTNEQIPNLYWRAFDDNINTFWHGRYHVSQSLNVNIQFVNPRVVSGYKITAGGGLLCPPTEFELQGSFNGTTWIDLEDNTNIVPEWQLANDLNTFQFNLENSTEYLHYRLVIHDSNDPTLSMYANCHIFEIELIEYNNFIVTTNGNVGISNINPSEKLYVNGNILATGTIFPDYVFEKYFDNHSDLKPNYKLMPLEKVIDFSREHKHLPNIPSVQEIEKQGGIIINKAVEQNLEKIEELHIYIYELTQEVEQLKQIINEND